ncbi:MAG TPA: transcriptional regulator [Firmicutes bacterium]|nr:transcriptional regulator [Bacillota bacterium]
MIEEAREIAELLKVLANENRLMIICHLLSGPMTVSQLHEQLNHVTQSALSQHLAILKANRLLSSTKNGQSITYAIQDYRIEALIETIKVNYCKIN